MIHVRLQQFEGPLDLLLQLIEKEELDISSVSLAEVTDQYLGTLDQIERRHPDELADFLVVAVKLLVIKSRTLLPQLDVPEEEGIPLEAQLRLYKTFVGASSAIAKLYGRRHVMFPREHSALLEPMFMPPARLGAADLAQAFREALHRLEPVATISQTTIARTASLHQKILSIRELISTKNAVNFRQLLEQAETRMDIIVTFLAILELVKQRSAVVAQDVNFSEIQITTVSAEAPAESQNEVV